MEQDQFKKTIVPLRPMLINCAKRIVENNEEAEDIVQDVFFKLWQIRNSLHEYDNVAGLSMTITKNLSINSIKKNQKRQCELTETAHNNGYISPHLQLEQKEEVENVMKIIENLPNLQKNILRMKHIDGLETDEIAELTGSSHEAIRVNLSRARKRVKELFLKIDKNESNE